jgi:hypothetical protein
MQKIDRVPRLRGRLIRSAGRPRGELLRHLTGKLAWGPASQLGGYVPDLIRRLTADTEGNRRAKQGRTRVIARAFWRRLRQRYLLKRPMLSWSVLAQSMLNGPVLSRSLRQRARPQGTRLRRACLKRNLPALCALIAIEELREVFSLVGVDPDYYPGFTPRLFERVADVAHYRLPGRDG